MSSWHPAEAVVERLYKRANAERWAVPRSRFAAVLERSARKAFASEPAAAELERYLTSLHLEDLALACACAQGNEAAWEHFVREHRPALYRAADAIDSTGGGRELADSLYGELFGLTERDGERRSHFDYFHGRSSLGTWLRAVLAQRHVDRVRSTRRLEPLPESPDALGAAASSSRVEPQALGLIRRTLSLAVSQLPARDRLRLAYYYAHDLTLAQIGRLLGEHEATVSRSLARTRRQIREGVERTLRETERMTGAQIAECFDAVVEDAGTLDVADLLGTADAGASAEELSRKEGAPRRSKGKAENASA